MATEVFGTQSSPIDLGPFDQVTGVQWVTAKPRYVIGGVTNFYNTRELSYSDSLSFSNVFSEGDPSAFHTFLGIAYGNDRWVAAGQGPGYVTSINGSDWQSVGSPQLTSVAFGNGIFVGAGEGALYKSVDGLVWVVVGSLSHSLDKVYFAGNLFFAGDSGTVSPSGDPSVCGVHVSSNGTDWQYISNLFVGGSFLGEIATIVGVAYGNGRYVLAGVKPTSAFVAKIFTKTSGNGRSWSGNVDTQMGCSNFGQLVGQNLLTFNFSNFFLCGQTYEGVSTNANKKTVKKSSKGTGWSTVHTSGNGAYTAIASDIRQGSRKIFLGGRNVTDVDSASTMEVSLDGLGFSSNNFGLTPTNGQVLAFGIGSRPKVKAS